MKVIPLSLKEAQAFVNQYHRHHKNPQGHKFSIGCMVNNTLVGICIVGRPLARMLDDGLTLEVTRLCTLEVKNICSFLYAKAARASKEMGYKRLYTYTLKEESGISLRASGWTLDGTVKGRSWSCPSRLRVDKHPLVDKNRWVKHLN
jgi:hypothetical protein